MSRSSFSINALTQSILFVNALHPCQNMNILSNVFESEVHFFDQMYVTPSVFCRIPAKTDGQSSFDVSDCGMHRGGGRDLIFRHSFLLKK